MKNLTSGNIYKSFFLFSLPMVLAGVLNQGYSIINTVVAGQLIGDEALGAIGAISPLETFVNSIFWGYGNGLGIFVAQLFGAGEKDRLKSVIVNNLKMICLIIAALSLILIIFKDGIYFILQIDPAIIGECNAYYMITMAGRVAVLFTSFGIFICNAVGDSAFPLLMSIISSILNILISVVSVISLNMGVEALALGNVASSAVVSLCYIVKYFGIFKKLGVNRLRTPFSLGVIKETTRFSVATMCQQSVMYLSSLLLSPMVNMLGSAASAGYAVTLRIYDVTAAIYQNAAKTLGSYTAQAFGGGKYHLLKKGLKVGFIQNIIYAVPVILACIFFAPAVTSVFYPADADPLSVGYTVAFLQYCLPFIMLNIIANLLHHFFRGVAYFKALLISTVAGSAARVVVSMLLIGSFGIYGYYAGWVMSWLFDAAVGIILYRFGKWRKKIKAV